MRQDMNYISTRGGAPASSEEAIYRGLSKTGGLFIPEKLPEALPLEAMFEKTPAETMALFFHRFMPNFSLEVWESIVDEALLTLTAESDAFDWPVHPLNAYLERYYLLNGDRLPTGSLSDISSAIFLTLLRKLDEKRNNPLEPLIVAVITDDMAVSSLRMMSAYKKIFFVSQNGGRSSEISWLLKSHEKAFSFEDSFDTRYREFSGLAADESFEKALNAQGYDPIFWGPGHILEVLTAGALVTASLALILAEKTPEDSMTYVVNKNHLSFFAGLVYANSLELPIDAVYVGENEPAILRTLFETGKMMQAKRRRRSDDPGVMWPVNLERLLFEVTGRDESRLLDIMGKWDQAEVPLLNEDEIHLLNQSVTVASNDYRRCLRIIRNIYDQTDYLIGRETADAIACWARHSDKKDTSIVCYVQERSPLLDIETTTKAILGDEASRRAEADAVCMLAEESGVPIWETLRASLEKKEPLTMIPVADSLQDTIFEAVRKHDHERGVDA